MHMNVFFLSIQDRHVQRILQGIKLWEFRANPRFGITEGGALGQGDVVFLISRFEDPEAAPSIACMGRVLEVLRGEDMRRRFSDKGSGLWREAGCREGTDRDWGYFVRNILHAYQTAVRLEPHEIRPAVDVGIIRHKNKGTPWRGLGFTPARDLKRFSVNGLAVESHFRRIARDLLDSSDAFRDSHDAAP